MLKPLPVLLLLCAHISLAQDKTIATFEVAVSDTGDLNIPVTVELEKIHLTPGAAFLLREMDKTSRKSRVVPYQLSPDGKTMTFLVQPGKGGDHKGLTYQAVHGKYITQDLVAVNDHDGILEISSGRQRMLRYVHKTIYPPKGIDTNFKRSGFIHPLWTPNGDELTRIQPPDHYHHYGIWNPWTHTLFENDTIDFWNIREKTGTVRFAGLHSIESGAVYGAYEAVHEHVIFKKDGSLKTALNEIQHIRIYKAGNDDGYYIFDFTSTLSCASQSPLLILAYRYGGLGWRATGFWDRDNSEMLTSQGRTRDNADGTRARWCMVYGTFPTHDTGGVVIMSHPSNYNHPEPLRIWDRNANNGRGDVFTNFAPTKDRDWLLEPGNTYVLKYRFIVFNGKLDAARAEAAWRNFAKPPSIRVLP